MKFQGSLRARFALGLGAMLLPLQLLGASPLFLLNYTTAALEKVVEEAIEEMHPAMRLQTLTLMAAMPPNDYLIHGDPAEKKEFARLAGELEKSRAGLDERSSQLNALNQIAIAITSLLSLQEDIDHFKTGNDSYGHQAGDEVLCALATRQREQSRPVDQAARYGGEEFVLILPEIASEGALALAERLRAAVADSAVALTEGRTIPVTISIGVATFPADAGSGTALIAAADAALYAVKQGGRSRTMRYQAASG